MSTLETKLKKLKGFDLSTFHANLWIIKRELKVVDRTAKYEPLFVEIENKLRKKLTTIVKKAVAPSNHVQAYEFLNADQDEDTALSVSASDTDLKSIQDKIHLGSDGSKVTDVAQLFNSWAYAIQLTQGKHEILAIRKITEGWKVKQVERYLQVVFRDRMLVDLDDKAVFRLEAGIDFFSFEDDIFILNKRRFESVLNFRQGMEKSRDEVLEVLSNSGIIDKPNVLKDAISDKLLFLRRIASIKKNAYYKQEDFLKKCKEVCRKRKWPVEFDGDKMIVTPDNVDIVLRLLNQDRLTSLITDEDFDVDAKHKVSPPK